MKIRKTALIAAAAAALLLLAGCAKSDDTQFETVFGVSAAELIPTVGNTAYTSRSLVTEAEQPAQKSTLAVDPTTGAACGVDDQSTVAAAAASAAQDTYVDPTAGLDCSED